VRSNANWPGPDVKDKHEVCRRRAPLATLSYDSRARDENSNAALQEGK